MTVSMELIKQQVAEASLYPRRRIKQYSLTKMRASRISSIIHFGIWHMHNSLKFIFRNGPTQIVKTQNDRPIYTSNRELWWTFDLSDEMLIEPRIDR